MLLNAALDGELDAAGMIAIEARLAAEPALAAEYARLVAVRDVYRRASAASRARPIPSRAKVVAMAAAAGEGRRPRRAACASPRRRGAPLPRRWRSVLRLAPAATGCSAPPSASDDVQQAIIAGFVRGRLSGQPVDVATSTGTRSSRGWPARSPMRRRSSISKADGFPLVGGRIDVVGKTPVATLIYQRREHQIALSEMPASLAGAPTLPQSSVREGYSLLEWTDGGRLFAAVSDLPPGELDAFGATSAAPPPPNAKSRPSREGGAMDSPTSRNLRIFPPPL